MSNPRTAIGGNNPPVKIEVSEPEEVRAYLEANYPEVSTRYAELMASAAEIPERVNDDVNSGKLGDLIKEMRKWDTSAESGRKIEKEPFQKGGATVDSFFKQYTEAMDKEKKRVTAIQDDYLNRKKAEAKRLAEENAKLEREKAERVAREAAEAEERRIAADAARDEALEKEREAKENKDELEQGRLDAEALVASLKLKKANARRDRDEGAFNDANTALALAAQKLVVAKESLRAARKKLADEAAARERADREARTRAREQENKLGEAVVHEARADKMDRKIENATDADFARTRGDHGSVNTLARRWTSYIADVSLVRKNIAMLAEFITADDLQVLVNKRASAGNRDVPGVTYEQVSESRAV